MLTADVLVFLKKIRRGGCDGERWSKLGELLTFLWLKTINERLLRKSNGHKVWIKVYQLARIADGFWRNIPSYTGMLLFHKPLVGISISNESYVGGGQ